MSENVRLTGGCQCGAVRYALHKMPERPCICHCRMCQKSSGNIFATFAGVEAEFFELTRGELSFFQTSEKGERCFCNKCGTPLAWRDRDNPWISVTIGSLDNPEAVRPIRFYGEEGRVSWAMDVVSQHGTKSGTDASGARNDWPLEEIFRTNRQHPDHDTAMWPPQPS
jgi:hypothetical protein